MTCHKISELTDENLSEAINALKFKPRDTRIALGRWRKNQKLVAVGSPLPPTDVVLVPKAELLKEAARRGIKI